MPRVSVEHQDAEGQTIIVADGNTLAASATCPAGRGARWMVLTVALLGWMFDGFEMSLFPLVGQPALVELLPGQPGEIISRWFAVIMAAFLVGAATGGVLFGWLGDRVGRVRAM